MQQSNLAMMLLGKASRIPKAASPCATLNPQNCSLTSWKCLRSKPKATLNKEAEMLLKQSLMALRMAFVKAVESPPPPAKTVESPAPSAEPETTAATKPETKPRPRKTRARPGRRIPETVLKKVFALNRFSEGPYFFFSSGFSGVAGPPRPVSTAFNFSSRISTFASFLSFAMKSGICF